MEVLKTMPQEVTFDVRHSSRLERKISRRKVKGERSSASEPGGRAMPASAGDLQASARAAARRIAEDIPEETSRDLQLDFVVEKQPGESLGFGFAGGAGKPLMIRRVRRAAACSPSL